jgi:pilus assembly protein CpaC
MDTREATGRGRSAWLAALAAVAAILWPVLAAGAAQAAAQVINLTAENRVGTLQIVTGTSETVRISLPFSEIVVGDPETADVNPLTDKTLYVLGKKLGLTNVALFGEDKQLVGVIDVQVTHNLAGLRQALKSSLPRSSIKVRSLNGRVLLEGQVSNAPAAEKAMSIARDFAGDDVTNSLSIAANQQVNLEVRFVEVARTAGKDLGFNWDLTDNNNGVRTGTGIFEIGAFPGVGTLSNSLPFGTVVANILSNGVSPDLLISALEQKKLARRLAEPNLVAMSGETASFLAGGEFPVPVAQDDRDSITIEFKEFGVRLSFTPVVLDDGLISLKVQPEVSEIDPTNSIRTADFLIPGLVVRRASTAVELRDGQSFAIAGLLQSVNQKTADQVPWIGDVPVLGTLFRSSSFQKKESDLVIIVTPRLAQPVGNAQVLATPLDNPLPSNEPEFFLLGEQEVSRKDLDKKYHGVYGHILDLPQVNYGTPNK